MIMMIALIAAIILAISAVMANRRFTIVTHGNFYYPSDCYHCCFGFNNPY